MTVFPFQIGEVTGLYNRVMKARSRGPDVDPPPERNDVVTISSEGKRQQVIDETKAAVLARIKGGG